MRLGRFVLLVLGVACGIALYQLFAHWMGWS